LIVVFDDGTLDGSARDVCARGSPSAAHRAPKLFRRSWRQHAPFGAKISVFEGRTPARAAPKKKRAPPRAEEAAPRIRKGRWSPGAAQKKKRT